MNVSDLMEEYELTTKLEEMIENNTINLYIDIVTSPFNKLIKRTDDFRSEIKESIHPICDVYLLIYDLLNQEYPPEKDPKFDRIKKYIDESSVKYKRDFIDILELQLKTASLSADSVKLKDKNNEKITLMGVFIKRKLNTGCIDMYKIPTFRFLFHDKKKRRMTTEFSLAIYTRRFKFL